MAGTITVLFLIGSALWLAWFFGRIHEAGVEARLEEQDAAAYRYAAAHIKPPAPVIKTRYVDIETGIVLEEREG